MLCSLSGADLDVIAVGKQAQLKTNRPEIFETGFDFVQRAANEIERTAHGLKVDIAGSNSAHTKLR